MDFQKLIGKTFIDIKVNDAKDEILFIEDDGTEYKMFHRQDCCEGVSIDDINGDLNDLLHTPILLADESTDTSSPKSTTYGEGEESWSSTDESSTWTFYKLATAKGFVDIKWYGSSNGYYSESVSLVQIGTEEDDY